MDTLWFKVRGYVSAAVALVACPCHLPLTLPLLLALTAGTALGGLLRQNIWLIYGTSTVLFVGGLYFAGQWLLDPDKSDTRTLERRRPSDQRRTPTPRAASENGRPMVTLVHTPNCSTCPQVQTLWRELQVEADFDYEEVTVTSERGRELAARYNMMSTPVTLINGEVAFRGEPVRDEALAAVRTQSG